MRERLPQLARAFIAGDLDYRMFQTVVYRTDLITDREVLAKVDAELAVKAPRWPSMTPCRLAGQIDKIVAKCDADAVRRRREAASDRDMWIGDRTDGLSEIHGSLFTPDARALDKRLDSLVATVCPNDPRTRDQRPADAMGALAAGAERLGCQCGRVDCCAGGKAASPVVIHVIAEQATVDGAGGEPGSIVEADGLIPPEIVEELAKSAYHGPRARVAIGVNASRRGAPTAGGRTGHTADPRIVNCPLRGTSQAACLRRAGLVAGRPTVQPGRR